ncbi:MAG: ABC transporter substrate-binding protein [Candidatus Thorarchaeota archaeon]
MVNRTKAIIAIVLIVVVIGAGYFLLVPQYPTRRTMVMGTTDSVEVNLDPARAYDYFSWEIITAVSAGLVEIKPGSEAGADDIEPALAESWSVDETGKVWTFNLRQGVTFDGHRPFDASVVKYTFDRNCNLTGDGLWEPDGPQLNMEYDSIIENVTIVSDYVVRFYLKIPFAPFLQLLSCAASYMVDPMRAPKNALVNYVPGNASASNPCGLGPYVLAEWVRTGGTDERMKLVKNPYYWNINSGIPKMDEIVIYMYTSSSALASAMAAGEIDIAFRQLTAAQIQSFKTNPNVRVWEGIGAQIQYMCFNQNFYPLNITEVRRAITAAINRTHVTETVFLGSFTPLWSMIPAGMAYHEDVFRIYGSANYSYTRSILAKYGYSETNKLELDLWYETSGHYPQSAEQAAVYKSDLEGSGVITVNLHGVDWSTYAGYRSAGSMQVFIYGWYPDFVDPDNYAFLPFASWLHLGYDKDGPANATAQYNLWIEGRSATTETGRANAYRLLQLLQADECSVIPLWQSNQVAVTSPYVHGVVLDITANWRHWLLYFGPYAQTGP